MEKDNHTIRINIKEKFSKIYIYVYSKFKTFGDIN